MQVPLTLNSELLTEIVKDQAYVDPGGTARVWDDGQDCGHLTLSDPKVETEQGRLRVTTAAEARVGRVLGARCLTLLDWSGSIETLQELVLDPEAPIIHPRIVDSKLYDADGREQDAGGVVWDWVKGYVHPRLERIAIDLSPTFAQLNRLLTEVLPSQRRETEPLSLSEIAVREPGVVATLSLELPQEAETPASQAGPEPALTRRELERWDAFVTSVVKRVAMDGVDAKHRPALLGVLLDARRDAERILRRPARSGGDPLRALFMRSWQRLAPILRELGTRHPQDAALRYLSFIAAGDALRAIDRVGPHLGLELSGDGLRRLARIIAPDGRADPLEYDPEVDPLIRRLFGFGAPLPMPERDSKLDFESFFIAPAHAQERPAAKLAKRLNGWIPDREEIPEYLKQMRTLLDQVANGVLSRKKLDRKFHKMFRPLVLATAWKESCWRQFVVRDRKYVPLESGTGSVGIMQVNPKVWRGFYDLHALQWDVGYNASAGGEILLHYLVDYAIPRGEHTRTGSIDNLARATYGAYNGGPGALRRYRDKRAPARAKRVDSSFWKKYRTIKQGDVLAVASCYVQ